MLIRQRLLIGYVVLAVLVAAVGISGLAATRLIVQSFYEQDTNFPSHLQSASLAVRFSREIQNSLALYLLKRDPIHKEQIFQHFSRLLETIHALKQTEDPALVKELESMALSLLSCVRQLIEGPEKNSIPESLMQIDERIEVFCKTIEEEMQRAIQQNNQRKKAAAFKALHLQNWILIGIIIADFSALLLGYWLARSISFPISKLQKKTEEVRKGNLDVVVEISSRDEIEQLGRSFNTMIQDLKKSQEEIRRWNVLLEQRVEERTRELQEALKDLETFAYAASHDLRVPLKLMEEAYDLLLSKHLSSMEPDSREIALMIEERIQKMQQMVEHLISYMRLSHKELEYSSINMEQLAGEVWNEIKALFPDRDVDFEILSAPEIRADRILIRHVLSNLFHNALKFSMPNTKGKIVFGGTVQQKSVLYFVKDSGIGFDMKYSDKLFQPFQRIHSGEGFSGTGLGLAIVQRIIQRHGGSVCAKGEIGIGSTFSFSLPLI